MESSVQERKWKGLLPSEMDKGLKGMRLPTLHKSPLSQGISNLSQMTVHLFNGWSNGEGLYMKIDDLDETHATTPR